MLLQRIKKEQPDRRMGQLWLRIAPTSEHVREGKWSAARFHSRSAAK